MDQNSYRIYMGPAGGASGRRASFTPAQLKKTKEMLSDERLAKVFCSEAKISVDGVIKDLKVFSVSSASRTGFAVDSVRACFNELVALFPDAFLMLEHDGLIIEKHQPAYKDAN